MLSQSLKRRTRFWHYISRRWQRQGRRVGTGQDYGSKTGKHTKQKPEEQEKVGENVKKWTEERRVTAKAVKEEAEPAIAAAEEPVLRRRCPLKKWREEEEEIHQHYSFTSLHSLHSLLRPLPLTL